MLKPCTDYSSAINRMELRVCLIIAANTHLESQVVGHDAVVNSPIFNTTMIDLLASIDTIKDENDLSFFLDQNRINW